MTTKAEVIKAAEKAAIQEEYVRGLGLMNTPTTFEKKVDSDATYRLATDIMYRYQKEYRDLFDKWYSEGAKDD